MSRWSTVVLVSEPDGLGYVVTVPALPGGVTQAARAPEAIGGYVAALVETGEPDPIEDSPALLTAVDVDELALAADRIRCCSAVDFRFLPGASG